MSDIAIRVENLSKAYRITRNQGRSRYKTLQEDLLSAPRKLWSAMRRDRGENTSATETFWALDDISFQVKQGEVLGIIGRNGAGKSTLLKILSRITEPTKGRAKIYGRVGSLLEVGTGFHPELTGRENIFLNGAILGMRRNEIARHFDEIVEFAEVEQFIDTPVKRYSSGMYMRLAFAVAAHLNPEILVVDEVLAVGDAEFQKKCLGKMSEVSKSGRTVLFVSHNMAAVSSLCEHGLLLKNGNIAYHGPTDKAVHEYLPSVITTQDIPLDSRTDRSGDGSARIRSIRVTDLEGNQLIRSSSSLKVSINYTRKNPVVHPQFLVGIYDYSNSGLFLLDTDTQAGFPKTLPPEGNITCTTAPINLTPGRCFLNVAVFHSGIMADYIQQAASFEVEADVRNGTGKIPTRDWVLCLLNHEWHIAGSEHERDGII